VTDIPPPFDGSAMLPPQGPSIPGAPPTPPGGFRSPLSDGDWHRMHPLTPLLRGGLVLVVVAGLIISNLRERIADLFISSAVPGAKDFQGPPDGDPIDFVLRHNLVLVALLVVAGLLLVLIGLFYLSWRFHTFRITGDDVEVRQGVLFRSQRRAPLDRVQGVNLTRPLIARLVGMAKLDVLGAGSDSNVKLEYLSTKTAEAVRSDILRLASGRKLAEAVAAGRVPGAARPRRVAQATTVVTDAVTGMVLGAEEPVEPASVVEIPMVRLLLSHLFSQTTLWLIVLIALIAWGSWQTTPILLVSVIPTLIGFGTYWVRSLAKKFRYSIAPTSDGVRITYGLFTTITEILPPGRVHAVEVSQPLLWRPAGWWAVRVNRLSGKASSSRESEQAADALPVGDRADAERVMRLLLPGLAEDAWSLVFSRGVLGPRAPRLRAARQRRVERAWGHAPSAGDDPFTTTPKRAWILRPLSWRRNGYVLTDDVLMMRRGFIWRKLVIVPLARLQSFGIEQGPLDRALGVAEVHAHTIAGRVSGRLGAIDRDAVVGLFAAASAGAVRAGAGDRSHRWADGVPDAE
jgi:putative membrane protein